MSDLGDLLQQLESEGKKDSSGFFTLDVRKLLPKLAEFQLARREDYVLKIVQGAVASGATVIQVRCDSAQVRIEYDGRPLAERELENLFNFVFDDRPSALRHLAIGVSTALVHMGRWVQVESHGQLRRWTALEDSTAAKPPSFGRVREGWTRFVLARPLAQVVDNLWAAASKKDLFQMMSGHKAAMLPEQLSLWLAGERCPARLMVNGRNVVKPRLGEAVGGWEWLLSRIGLADLFVPHDYHLIEWWLHSDRQAGFGWPKSSCAALYARPTPDEGVPALLAIRSRLQPLSEFHFFQAGVRICTARSETGVPGLLALVSADDLEVDLSQFGLIQNEQFRERRRWVERVALEMAHYLKANMSKVPVATRRLRREMEALPPLP